MYYAKHRVEREILCFAVKYCYISIENPYLLFEGGLLCVKD